MFHLIRGLDLDFWGENFFFDHATFLVPNTLFVILDVLVIPGEFGGKIFPLKNGLDLKLFSEKISSITFFGLFHIDEYFDTQEQFAIQKFPIRDVLVIAFFGAFCGL